ncbi:MAG: YCF48-related protein [candidate division WOR-3 bacterium]
MVSKKKVNKKFSIYIFLLIIILSSGHAGWRILPSGVDIFLRDISFADSLRGWIAGDYDFFNFDSSILHTTNGRDWIELWSPINSNLNSICFIDSLNGWVVSDIPFAEITDSIIAHTTDGGMSWSKQRSPELVHLNSVHFVNQTRGWAVGNLGKIIATVNGGDLWVSQNSGTAVKLNDIYFVDQLNGWTVGDSGKIIHTTNGGISWSIQTSGIQQELRAVYFYNLNIGWVVGNSGTVLTTTNGGNEWVLQNSGVNSQLNDVFFTDIAHGWAVGDSGRIIYTIDGGNNWAVQSSGVSSALFGLFFINQHKGWAAGGAGTILFYEDIPPSTPVLIAPPESSRINDLTLAFLWHRAQDYSGIKRYYLQIDTTDNFVAPIISDSTVDTVYLLTNNLANRQYWWRVCAMDSANNIGSWSLIWTFFVDTVRPYVIGTVPALGDTGVLPDVSIYATFSELMDSVTMVPGNFSVVGSVSGVHVFGVSYSNLDSTVCLDPVDSFYYAETVVVTIRKEVCDLAGNMMVADKVWEFYMHTPSLDNIGPVTSQLLVTPNPTQGAQRIVIKGTVSDSTFGNSIIESAEIFVDSIGPDSTGIALAPLDGVFDEITEEVIDTMDIANWQFGTSRWLFVHGLDASGNWGNFDSICVIVTPPPPDTTPPTFDITIIPQEPYIGDTITIRTIPSEPLCFDSAVICSITTQDSTIHTLTLAIDTSGYYGKMCTAGFTSGVCVVRVSGYDLAGNKGSSSTKFNITAKPGEFMPEDMVYAWPNPARGNEVNFHFYVTTNADVTVEVFNLRGKLVTRLNGYGEGGRPPHQLNSNVIKWDITKIASDIYIFKLLAKSRETGETKTVVKKFAIVK